MFKPFSVLALSIGLIACGGDSSDSANGIGAEMSPSLQGPASAPALSTINGNLSDGSTIPLNTKLSTSIAANADVRFSFTAGQDMLLAVILDGDDGNGSDLDLTVGNQGGYGYSANEAVITELDAGDTISIGVESLNDFATNYTLTVVTANRESLGLKAGEYGLIIVGNETETCGDRTYRSENTISLVVSPNGGYLRDFLSGERSVAKSASGNTLTFSYSGTETGSDYRYTSSSEAKFTINPETGAVSGTETGSTSETDEGTTTNCTFTISLAGQLVL